MGGLKRALLVFWCEFVCANSHHLPSPFAGNSFKNLARADSTPVVFVVLAPAPVGGACPPCPSTSSLRRPAIRSPVAYAWSSAHASGTNWAPTSRRRPRWANVPGSVTWRGVGSGREDSASSDDIGFQQWSALNSCIMIIMIYN